MVEDEVALEEFTKLVTYFVDFTGDDTVAKCSCGLFEMRGILCRHILAVFRCNDIRYLPEIYILDRWRKAIKRRYTLIQSSYDEGDQRPDANRYSSLLSICYQMITHAAGSRKHTEDARSKLYAMIELYRANGEPPSFTQIGSNANDKANDTTVGCSGEVHSPRVVRGKCRPPSLRRASRMEIDMRKAKTKTKKAPAKGKRKEQAILSVGIDITTTQAREIVMQSQESQALVGEGSGEEQLFSSESISIRDGIGCELDGYLQKLKEQYGVLYYSLEVETSPRVHRFQIAINIQGFVL
ncbi:hypothetical protein CIPAW_02G031800 [Carya illinoinensis]|uniref:Protein FAR1-RELATED SEQUENCE n=1 Tax=Carya illinoinensis TaxID=32201 RepID=A0A8T1R9G5_CARIL|nr:hypothetical protein CIPAW_02G031800 [Carya illinoinensis]